MLEEHHQGTLNCERDDKRKSASRSTVRGMELMGFCNLDHSEIKENLRGLMKSEPLSVDGLPSGAFRYAPANLIP